jgi:hypothetical protein
MTYLTTVVGSFHGRVLAARLGAEGVLVVLKGGTDPYPVQTLIDVLVPADQLSLAREILLADAVDDAFGSIELADAAAEEHAGLGGVGSEPAGLGWDETEAMSASPAGNVRGRLRALPRLAVVVLVAVLIVAGCLATVIH